MRTVVYTRVPVDDAVKGILVMPERNGLASLVGYPYYRQTLPPTRAPRRLVGIASNQSWLISVQTAGGENLASYHTAQMPYAVAEVDIEIPDDGIKISWPNATDYGLCMLFFEVDDED